MTRIDVTQPEDTIVAEFIDTGYEMRLWLYDKAAWQYRTVGQFCPHKITGGGECWDCGLVLEEDE